MNRKTVMTNSNQLGDDGMESKNPFKGMRSIDKMDKVRTIEYDAKLDKFFVLKLKKGVIEPSYMNLDTAIRRNNNGLNDIQYKLNDNNLPPNVRLLRVSRDKYIAERVRKPRERPQNGSSGRKQSSSLRDVRSTQSLAQSRPYSRSERKEHKEHKSEGRKQRKQREPEVKQSDKTEYENALTRLGEHLKRRYHKQAITITFRSVVQPSMKVVETFTDPYHFIYYMQQLLSPDEQGSDPTKDDNLNQLKEKDLFKHITYRVKRAVGGCSAFDKNGTDKVWIGDRFNVIGRYISERSKSRNDCGLLAVDYFLYGDATSSVKRDAWRDKNEIKRCEKLTIPQVYEYYNDCVREMKSDEDVVNRKPLFIVTRKEITPELVNQHAVIVFNKHGHYTPIVRTEVHEEHTKKKQVQRRLLAWDVETGVFDKCRRLKETILHAVYRTNGGDRRSQDKDKTVNIQHIYFRSLSSQSACRQFLDWLKDQHTQGYAYRCYAHNGARFDHYFLMQSLTQEELLDNKIFSHFRKGFSIISMRYYDTDFRDSYQFLTFSLSYLCKSFDTQQVKLSDNLVFKASDGTTHHLTSSELCFWRPGMSDQDRAMAGGITRSNMDSRIWYWDDMKQFNDMCDKEPEYTNLYNYYCEMDCRSLLEIVSKMTKCCEKLFKAMNDNFDHILGACRFGSKSTIGALARSVFEYLVKENPFIREMKKFTSGKQDKNDFLRKCIRGGISHCNKPGRYTNGVVGLDVKSLYPAAMIHGRVAIGFSSWTKKEQPGKHGYYRIQNLRWNDGQVAFRPIAQSVEGRSLQWSNDFVSECYIRSHDLEYIKQKYPNVTYTVIQGLVSDEDVEGEKICGRYVKKLYDAKAEQDLKKKMGACDYNPALRETIKLFLNSLSGKFVECTEKYVNVAFDKEQHRLSLRNKIAEEGDALKKAELQARLDGLEKKKLFFDLETVEKPCKKLNDLLPLGLMVYSQSRIIMFDYMDLFEGGVHDIIHVETDSLYFEKSKLAYALEKMKAHPNPVYRIGEELGNMAFDKDNDEGIFLTKKTYALKGKTMSEDKVVWKGCSKKTINENGTSVNLLAYSDIVELSKGNVVEKTISSFKREFFDKAGPQLKAHFITRRFQLAALKDEDECKE